MHTPKALTPRAARTLALALAVLLTGCATRSISNAGRAAPGANTTYAGELSDFDVVGTATNANLTPDEFVLRPRDRVLVVQSGAAFPDERMLAGLAAHFDVAAASGIPTPALGSHGMRTAAKFGGFDAVLAYWGILESSERPTGGVAASWVPVAGWFVPDADQRVRIRMRIVVMQVSTGRWRTLLPEPIEDRRSSSMLTRESSDRKQVEVLIGAAVPAAIAAIERALLRP